ncbi:MAG TPA: hypothetical protein PLQ35_00700, partial [bacterium]|nr:hypothetical protein [bacterium]HQL60789.1 hypothetical protein [bacterium]
KSQGDSYPAPPWAKAEAPLQHSKDTQPTWAHSRAPLRTTGGTPVRREGPSPKPSPGGKGNNG